MTYRVDGSSASNWWAGKRPDIAATAIHCGLTVDEISDLDLTYTPPLGSPCDAVQIGAQAWERTR